MAKQERCICQAPLREDGKCPHGCETFSTPSWRRARAARAIRHKAESTRGQLLTREEATAGVLRAVPSYRRDFFEQSVRVRAKSSRKTRPVD